MDRQSPGRKKCCFLVVIPVIFLMVASCTQAPMTEWDYQQFIQAVEQDEVNIIRLSGDQSQVLFTKEGEDILVKIPSNDPNLISTLEQNNVDIVLVHSQSRFNQQAPWVGLGLRWSIPILIGLAPTMIWIWALLDCAIQEEGGSNTKLLWLLIILFTNAIGAIIYLFVRRPRRRREMGR